MGKNLVRTLASVRTDTEEHFLAIAHTFKQQDAEIVHRFAPGLYIREMFMKKGTLVIGEEHTKPCQNIIMKGKVRLLKPDNTSELVQAPYQFTGGLGRKIGYFLEDTLWVNVFATTARDVTTAEADVIKRDPHLELLNTQRLIGDSSRELSFRESVVFDEELPYGMYLFRKVDLGDTSGLFATANIRAGVVLGLFKAKIFSYIARHIRFSDSPNCTVVSRDGIQELVAIKAISGCKGGLNGEELTIHRKDTQWG